jgi:hypothetical protein
MGKKSPAELTVEEIKAACATAVEIAAYTQKPPSTRPKGVRAGLDGSFIMVPREWQVQLLRIDADKCTYRLALYLLWEAWRTRGVRVKVTNVRMKEEGVGRRGKRQAVAQLERAGLVVVERTDHGSPVVRVKYTN